MQRELHLGQREPDAVPRPATERDPCRIERSGLGSVGREVAVGIEAQRVGPRVRVSPGEVRAQQHHRAAPDRVAVDRDVAGDLTRREHAGRVEPERLAHHGPRVRKLLERCRARLGRGPTPSSASARSRCQTPGVPARAEQRPPERRSGGVVARRDQRDHLVSDLRVGESGVRVGPGREQEIEHVTGLRHRLRAAGCDLGVDEAVEPARAARVRARLEYGNGCGTWRIAGCSR